MTLDSYSAIVIFRFSIKFLNKRFQTLKFSVSVENWPLLGQSANQIYDILVWIRWSGTANPCLLLMDPDLDLDPATFVIDLQDTNKKQI